MKLRRSFVNGRMNKDVDLRLLPENDFIHARNVRIVSPDGSNSGSVRTSLGNRKLTSFDYTYSNPKCIGYNVDRYSNIIRWLVKADQGSYIVEYDTVNDISSFILQDRRDTSNVLNFQYDYLATDVRVINDSDNGKTFMFITDNLNEIKYFNVEDAKQYAANS